MEKKVDALTQEGAGVKQEVGELRQNVQHLDQRLERLETTPPANAAMRRLEILENSVLRKAS